MMRDVWIAAGGISGFLAVAAGAFGAHALRGSLNPADMDTYHTAAFYHLVHSLALIGVGLLRLRRRSAAVELAGWCFLFGILIFCGSLYALVLSGQRWLGAITPIGGVALLAGWLALSVTGWPRRRRF